MIFGDLESVFCVSPQPRSRARIACELRVLRLRPTWEPSTWKLGKASSIRRLRSERGGRGGGGTPVARAPRAATDGATSPARAAARPAAGAATDTATATAMDSTSAPKQHKSRRKISLPWFRQSSVSAPHATLSRQHTIDTPGSFHARLLRGNRQRQVMRCDCNLHTY